MKKKFTFLMAAVMLLTMMVLPGKAVGQTKADAKVTITIDSFSGLPSGSASYATYDWTQDGISGKATIYANTSSTSMQFNATNKYFYSTSEISGVIKSIKLTTASGTNRTYVVYGSTSAYSGSGASYGTQIGSQVVTTSGTTFTVSSGEYTYFTIVKSGTGAGYLSSVEVTYTPSGGGSTVATPTFSPAEGIYTSAQNVTISCATQDATIYYTTDGSTPDNNSTEYTDAIQVSTTTTIKAIAYVDNDASSVASATYTILTPLTTMQAIYDANSTSTEQYVAITFNNWIITGSSTSYAFLSDGDKGLYIFGSGHGFVQGDILSGTVVCKLSRNTGMAKLTQLTSETAGIHVEKGANPTPTVTTINTMEGVNTGKLITLNGLTCHVNGNDYSFTDEENRLVYPYSWGGLSSFRDYLSNGKTYDVTGVFCYGNNTNEKRINPRSVTDIMPTPATLPFTWSGGVKADLMALTGVTAEGLGGDYAQSHGLYRVKFDGVGDYILIRTSSQPGKVTIGVKKFTASASTITIKYSTNGVTFTNLEDLSITGNTNTILSLETTKIFGTSVRYVKIEITSGSSIGVGPISIAKPSAEPSITVDSEKNIAHNTTLGSIEYEINNPVDGGVLTADITTITGDWLKLGTVTSEAVPFTCDANEDNSPRSATVTLTYTYGGSKDTKEAEVVVTQNGTPRYYALAKSIIPGKRYIITNGSNKAMGVQTSNNRVAVGEGVTISNGIATVTNNAVYEFDVNTTLINDETYYTFYDERYNADEDEDLEGGYLYAQGTNNYLRTQEDLTQNGKWSIEIDNNGIATIKSQTNGDRDWMRYNNTNDLFSCYKDGQNDIYLYMKVDTYLTDNGNWSDGTKWIKGTVPTSSNDVAINAACTIPSNGIAQASNIIIAGSSSSLTIEDGGQLIIPTGSTVAATFKKNMPATKNGKDDIVVTGWELISSPTNNGTDDGGSYENFASVTHLTDASYVLFKYDEKKRQWINSNHEGDVFTKLYVGQGYLYGNTTGKTVEFTGNVNSAESYTCSLTYNVKEGDNLAGFNLIGNPYSHELVWSTNVDRTTNVSNGYYKIVDDAFETTLYKTPIAPMQGILVQAQAVSQSVTFYNEEISGDKGEKANADNIMFKVENSEYSDVAYALFDKGYGLNKISHRGENVPMLYIPQDGTNYAIAMMDDNTNSFNLNFEAKTTGRYTLSYKLDGEFNYLHVIDRATGEDIDMLLEGSYSFIGSPMDNAQRFIVRLGYLPNYEDNGEDIFAYQSGNDIIVSGEGELQIFDVMGRKVSTMNIYGVETISGIAQGVYIFRMEGKTQKIVVR